MQRLRRVLKVERYFDCDLRALDNLYNHNGDLVVQKDKVYDSISFPFELYHLSYVAQVPVKYLTFLPARKKRLRSIFFPYWSKNFFKKMEIEELASSYISRDKISKALNYPRFNEKTVKAYLYILKQMTSIFTYSEFSLDNYQKVYNIVKNVCHFDREGLFKVLCYFRKKVDSTEVHSISVMLLMLQVVFGLRQNRFRPWCKKLLKEGKLKLSREKILSIGMGALLHDYGKVFVNEDIIDKDSSLALGELDLIRMHPYYGVRALSLMKVVDSTMLDIVGNHHYRYRVDETKQSLIAQICNIVDIYDACRAPRPYKEDFSFNITKEILQKENSFCKWNYALYAFIFDKELSIIEAQMQEAKS